MMIRRFDLGAEARFARRSHHLLGARLAVVTHPQPEAHRVELRQVRGALGRQDQVVGGQRVNEVRAGYLDDLGAEYRQQLDGFTGTAAPRPARSPPLPAP